MSLTLGLGSPTGIIGGEIEHLFHKLFAISAAAGWSVTGNLQVAAEARVRAVWATHALGLAAGVSRGDDEHVILCVLGCNEGADNLVFTNAIWANIGFNYEKRGVSGLLLRTSVGMTRRLAYDECIEGGGNCSDTVNSYPYVRIALGKAF